jgi:dolichyl-phosphate-mannose--protein O-mannosyl transferase
VVDVGGLPALLWCALDGLQSLARRSLAIPGKWAPTGRDRLSALSGMAALFYVGSLFFWAINGKPVQFYYHYQLAAVFLDAALALVLTQLWRRGLRWPVWITVALTLAGFIYFFPILAALPLPGMKSFRLFTWLPVWK